jgi:hypothetical protein
MSTILRATNKSAGRRNKRVFNPSRAFYSASDCNIHGGPRRPLGSAVSARGGKFFASNQVARNLLPSMIAHRNYDAGRNATTALTVTRASPGNPSTVAFLGIRAKSSGAAFRYQAENDLVDDVYSPLGASSGFANGFAAGAEGRGRQESWMVNLGREDESWLIGPRSGEWFTGLEPSVCPGESVTSVTEKGEISHTFSHAFAFIIRRRRKGSSPLTSVTQLVFCDTSGY